jgi:hypothetical protein
MMLGRLENTMSFCEHCQGQRFDRAQVLRALRDTRRRLRLSGTLKTDEQTLALAIETVRRMEIPHLEPDDDPLEGDSIH